MFLITTRRASPEGEVRLSLAEVGLVSLMLDEYGRTGYVSTEQKALIDGFDKLYRDLDSDRCVRCA